MKLKLLITLVGGIFNVAIHGADRLPGADDTGEPGAEELREVIPPLGDETNEKARAGLPVALVRSRGGGLLPIDPNIRNLKKEPETDAAPAGANTNATFGSNLEIPMARTASGFTEESEGVSSAGGSKTGSTGATPKAADAAAIAAGKSGFPSQKPQ
jgi:hypothetical protein